MATKTIEDLFEITFANRWAGKARMEVERRSISFWVKTLPKTTRGLSLGVIDKVILSEVKKGNKPSTINSKLQTLKTCLDFTRERGMHTLTFKMPRLKMGSDARIGFFSEENQERIEALIDDNDFRLFFLWSIETGLRPSESLGLSSKRVRKDPIVGPVVDVIKTKNGEPRTIPLTRKALEALETVGSWERMTSYRITREWARLRRKDPELLNQFVFYTCRHTTATRLLSKGVNIKVVQSWMGHKDINMTLRYAKLVPTDLAAARDILEA
jgi:integrase